MVRQLGGSGQTGSSFSIRAPTDEYIQAETDEPVEIAPGEQKTVITVHPEDAALWYEVGTKDATYSEYQWLIDGEPIFDNPKSEPLGLYNQPHRFPHPLVLDSQIQVKVKKTSDAPGADDFFSKVRYVPIAEGQAEKLRNAVKQL